MSNETPPADYDPFGPRWKGHGPNPDDRPNEDPDAIRARMYAYHKANGTMGTFYDSYPDSAPWDWGLTPEVRELVLRQQRGGRER